MSHDDRQAPAGTSSERVERDLKLPASPGDVWDVVTSDGWLAEAVCLELTPGGEARFTDGASVRTGWVEEACSPDAEGTGCLVFWWGPEGDPATRVSLTLEPGPDGGTRLRVLETRPLESIDVIGLPISGRDGVSHGPAMLARV